jgi:hypothetical protein
LNLVSFFEWHDLCRADLPWLILGKGPSFAARSRYDLAGYNVLTLNDAITYHTQADVAHFVDYEAFLRCTPALRACSATIAMPWHPHMEFKPADESLPELLVGAGHADLAPRVAYYHASTARSRGRLPLEPLVHVKFFSAEAALSLLAVAGARVVRTLGVDGGRDYAPEFAGLKPLENGARSFDAQFLRMRQTAAKHKVDFRALGEEDMRP